MDLEQLKRSLLESHKKLGDYSFGDFVGIGRNPMKLYDDHNEKLGRFLEIGFGLPLNGALNHIQYLSMGLPDICQWDSPDFFGMKNEDVYGEGCLPREKYFEKCKEITVYIDDKTYKSSGYLALIKGDFYNQLSGEYKYPATYLDVYWENPHPQHFEMSPEKIVAALEIEPVVRELEALCKEFDVIKSKAL